jgi:hypothetical protein
LDLAMMVAFIFQCEKKGLPDMASRVLIKDRRLRVPQSADAPFLQRSR